MISSHKVPMASMHQTVGNMDRLTEFWVTLHGRHVAAPWERLVSQPGGDWDTLLGINGWS